MSEPKSKMTLLLTPAERARLDELRLARGDRHASATLRALVRDAGGDPPRAPDARLTAALDLLAALPARAPAPRRRSENTLGLVDLAPGAVLPDPPRAPAADLRAPDQALRAACRRPGFVPDVLRRALIALGWSFADDGTGAIVWYPPACDPETSGQDGILAALQHGVLR